MFNSAKMYERMFAPTEGGFLYYPSNWSGGYFLTHEERDRLVAEWAETSSLTGTLKLVGIAMLALTLAMAAIFALGLEEQTEPFLGLGLGIALGFYLIWKYSAAYRLVRGREPVMPPRTAEENRKAIGRLIPLPMLLFVFAGISFSSASLLWVGLQGHWLPGLGGALLAWSAYAYLRIILTRLRSGQGN